jgi:hypothetical protein
VRGIPPFDSTIVQVPSYSDDVPKLKKTNKHSSPKPREVFITTEGEYGNIDGDSCEYTILQAASKRNKFRPFDDEPEDDASPTILEVRMDGKKKILVPETDIIYLYKEGYYVVHTEFGIGRVIVSSKELLPKICEDFREYTRSNLLFDPAEVQQCLLDRSLTLVGYVGVEFIQPPPGGHSLFMGGRYLYRVHTVHQLQQKKMCW